MARLARYIRPYWGYILLTVFIKLLGAVMELLIPYMMENMLDVKVPAGDVRAIFLLGAAMLLAAGGCLGFNILANRMSAQSSQLYTPTNI